MAPDLHSLVPPSNLEAERSVLGSCLRYGAFPEVSTVITASDFYLFAHQKIFEGMAVLHATGQPTIAASIFEWARGHNVAEDVRPEYLVELFDACPFGNPGAHAEIIRSKAIMRDLQEACRDVMREIDSPTMPDAEIVDMAERLIFKVGQRRSTKLETFSVPHVMNETGDRLEMRNKATMEGRHAAIGIPSAFADLDYLIGGLQDTELTIIAARPSVGKTAFGLNLFYNAMVLHKTPCLFVSLEQSRLELGERFYSRDAKIGSHKIRSGMFNDHEKERIVASRARFQSFGSWINDRPALTVAQIASEARRLKAKGGLRMLLIDYLQLIEPENKREQRHLQVGEISRRLKLLAKELSVPVVSMAQLNRTSEDRRPRLSDLRESGSIEQDSDNVILLHDPQRHDQHDPQRHETPNGPIEVLVSKQRQGPTGQLKLFFKREFCQFENMGSG